MQGANCKFANAGNANFPNLLPTAANNNNNKLFLPKYLATKVKFEIGPEHIALASKLQLELESEFCLSE